MGILIRRAAWSIVALLCISSSARATASIVEPVSPHVNLPALGFDWTASTALASPYGDTSGGLGDGILAGVGCTAVQTRGFGVGAGLSYLRWGSGLAIPELDQIFSAFSGTPIHGSKLRMSAWEADIHFHVTPFPERASFVQLQFGLGLYRLSTRLELPVDQLRAAGWTVRDSSRPQTTYGPIVTAGLGLDLLRVGRTKLGIDVSHDWLFQEDETLPLKMVRIGGHVVGRW